MQVQEVQSPERKRKRRTPPCEPSEEFRVQETPSGLQNNSQSGSAISVQSQRVQDRVQPIDMTHRRQHIEKVLVKNSMDIRRWMRPPAMGPGTQNKPN